MLEMADFIEELRAEESKEKYIVASYTAWQISSSEKSFGSYIKNLGLSFDSVDEKVSKEQRKIEINAIDKKVKKIMRLKKIKKKRFGINARTI